MKVKFTRKILAKVTSFWCHSVMSKVKVHSVSQSVTKSVTRSPIELFWTAKKDNGDNGDNDVDNDNNDKD